MDMPNTTGLLMGGSFQEKHRSSCLSTTNDKESCDYLPKCAENRITNRFSDLMNSYDSEEFRNSSSSLNFQNDQIALTYRINKLYQKVWKSLLLVKMKNMQATVLNKMARNHYRRKIMKKSLKGVMYYTQKSLISKLEKSKGEEIYKIRIYRKVIVAWRTMIHEKKAEDHKVQEVQEILDFKKKLVLMRKWKEAILSTQVQRAQNYTAEYVYKKKLLKKGMHSLKLFKAASKFEKCRWNNAVRFEQVKLLTTAFKTLHWYKSKKLMLHNLQLKMDSAYEYLTKKRGLKLFVRKSQEVMQKRKLFDLSLNFYHEKLMKRFYQVLKDHALLKKGLRNQETCIKEYHKERTLMKSFNRLRDYTKEKKDYRMNALLFKHRCYNRKILYLWKMVVSRTAVRHQPDCGAFYFISYIWIQQVYHSDESKEALDLIPNQSLPLMYYPDSLPVSTNQKYAKFNTQANKKLSSYIMQKVFRAWRDHITSVRDFRKNRTQKLQKEIIDFWKEYSNTRIIQRSKLTEFIAKSEVRTTQRIFTGLKEYLARRINLKKRQNEFTAKLNHKQVSQKFIIWRVQQHRSIIQKEQEDIADQMYKKHFQKYFYDWHKKFIKYRQLSIEDEKLKKFQKSKLLQK